MTRREEPHLLPGMPPLRVKPGDQYRLHVCRGFYESALGPDYHPETRFLTVRVLSVKGDVVEEETSTHGAVPPGEGWVRLEGEGSTWRRIRSWPIPQQQPIEKPIARLIRR